MINIKNLNLSFDDNIIFSHFDFHLDDTEIVSLKGPSGFGKTTFLKFLCGLNEECSFDEKTVSGKISFCFQEPRLLEHLTVKKNVMLAILNSHRKKESEQIAKKIMDLYGISEKAEEISGNLSGGEKQRVALARAMAFDSEIVLFDEAFNALDEANRKNLISKTIAVLKEQKRSAVFVSHDSSDLEGIRTIEIKKPPV